MSATERSTAAKACTCGASATRISSPFVIVGLTQYSHAYRCDSCSRIEFTPVDPLRPVIKVSSRWASLPCADCRGPISELPNPYYGVKRAMAPTIRFCSECDQA